MFWRKMNYHLREFIVYLWKGVDKAVEEYYEGGELVVSWLLYYF